MNKTYISYGALGSSKMEKQATQDANAMEVEEDVAVKRAVSKSSRMYKNATWDLVDAYEKKDFKVAELRKSDLPKELKGKTEKEITAYIVEKKKERTAIQKEIMALNVKREAYLSKNKKEDSEGALENAMFGAIKRQAAKKNYRWE